MEEKFRERNTPRFVRTAFEGAAVIAVILLGVVFFGSGMRTEGEEAVVHSSSIAMQDTGTQLFEDFEGDSTGWLSESVSAFVKVDSGYLGGQAVYLADTTAHLVFSDSWWAPGLTENFQDSGTLEFFIKAETWVFNNNPQPKLFQEIVTIGEQKQPPQDGDFSLAVDEEGDLYFGIAESGFYEPDEAHPAGVSLRLGEWYGIAAIWGPDSGIRLFVNGIEVQESNDDRPLAIDTFTVGAQGNIPNTRGHAFRGWIDNFRLSRTVRNASEMLVPMHVVIDSPSAGDTVEKPFLVKYRAESNVDTRTFLVDIYWDTDGADFNGTLLAANLPAVGQVYLGADLPDSYYYLYALAHTDGETSSFVMSDPFYVATRGSLNVGSTGVSQCLLERLLGRGDWEVVVRRLRDAVLDSFLGRALAVWYYRLGGEV
ncbi:MAG: hypothetical protein D6679_12500 [Candidatus Hydrogenedentota bacterium]|nr:MAG: hypothetical protein D6679_12500 [Candidatus Hydrogenedentota bacterium]